MEQNRSLIKIYDWIINGWMLGGKIANGQLKYTCCCAASVHVKYPNFKIIDSKQKWMMGNVMSEYEIL